jgi:RPA family protein
MLVTKVFAYLKLVPCFCSSTTRFIRNCRYGSVMAEPESSRRQVAYKVQIADLLNNRYVKEEGWLPNYIAVRDLKVSRANLIGVIVSKDSQEGEVVSQNFILDDGTGRLSLRFFEHGKGLEVGDIVNVIGRPREFGAERYMVPEIMKKVDDPKWVALRKMELAAEKQAASPVGDSVSEAPPVETEEILDESNPAEKIISILRELDSGSGVDFEELSVKFGAGNPEEQVKRLLEQGDIFEVKPGRYKLLE